MATNNKRGRDEPARQRAEVISRYFEGETQAEIAHSLGVSQQQISTEIKGAREEWRIEYARNSAEVFEQHLAKLMYFQRQYWKAWNESKTPKETTANKKGFRGEIEIEETTVTREKCVGNPAFLDGALRCFFKEIELRGLTVELNKKDTMAAIKIAKAAGYSVFEPGENDIAIALHSFLSSKLIPEWRVQKILAALKESEEMTQEKIKLAFTDD